MVNIFSRYKKIILTSVSIILLISIFAVTYVLSSSNISHDVNSMISNAEKLYNEGDVDGAYYQMLIYTQERPNDIDGWIKLGDYAIEQGNTDDAYNSYKKGAACIEYTENQLGEFNKIKHFDHFSAIETLKIYPTAKITRDMTLTTTSDNLTPQKTFAGQIIANESKLSNDDNYLTTDWFYLDESQKYVYITGNINCAQWQFIDSQGTYSRYVDESDFKNTDFHSFDKKTVSYAEIPQDCVKARVTYYDRNIDSNVKADDKIFIGYGKGLTGYNKFDAQKFELPDLNEGQYIEYKNKKWYLFDGSSEQEIKLPAINAKGNTTINIDGTLCGTVDVGIKNMAEISSDKSFKYGIKYNTKSSIASCERIGDALGMNFDYTVGDKWNFGTGNDFDKAYPWCEMKLCNVKVDENGEEKITLEGDKNFKTDGSNGNVMVRIPKFYTKREVKDGYEYIWISGKKHKGYKIEPVFIQSDGSNADYVYMSAYLGGLKDEKIVSMSGTYPALQLEYGTMLEYAENNGDGFDELNYLMVSALQKLFIVETGTIDSSEIFAGDTAMYYQHNTKDQETSGFAYADAKNSNVIKLYNNVNTSKISKGSSIAIFDGWKKYKNNNGTQREVTDINRTDDYIEITFDGKPINIKQNKTLITNIPAKTGKTDSIKYCTGTLEGYLGKQSFKYRNIENLFGSAFVILDDDAYVQDGYFYYETDDGYINSVDYKVAKQKNDLSNEEKINQSMCIKEMGYDNDNPTIMLPSVVGKGASAYGYYGDLWIYEKTPETRYIMYGGANNTERVAGIFQMSATVSGYDTKHDYLSARIMYK